VLSSRAARAACACIVVLATLALLGPSSPAQEGVSEADRASIQDLLDERATAWLERDRKAFMATMTRDSDAFRARQARALRWSEAVQFGSYRLVARWDRYGDLVTEAVESSYPNADAVAIPLTEERYRLAEFDEQPAVEDLFLTFVKTDGDWRIADDTDLDDLAFYSSRHAWDFGLVDQERRGPFLLLSHPCRAGGPCGSAPAGLLDLAETALQRVDAYWDAPWTGRVPVLIPRSSHELERMLQITFDIDNFVAFAYSTVDSRDGIDYTGHRIVLNPKAFVGRTADSTLDILAHELLHIATRPSSGPFVPTFAEEGLAEYVSNQGDPADLVFFDSEVAAGRFDGLLPKDWEFSIGDGTEIFRTYQKSYSAVRFLVERWGLGEFVRFYRMLGRVEDEPGTARYHVDRALQRSIGLNLEEFERAWAGTIGPP
jgi:hypothetical protein